MNKKRSSNLVKELITMVNRLRSDEGCPWLKQQTLNKQFNQLKKEITELENAIKNQDINNLKEELGDVFWDLLLLIKISEEDHDLKTEEILDQTRQKIMRRKPYVFGDEKAETPEEALAIWKKMKEKEKKS